MLRPLDKQTLARVRFYIAVVVLVAAVWGIQTYKYDQIYNTPGSIISSSSASDSTPNDWQKMSIQSANNANALLTTLATALLGAVGFLMSKAADGAKSLRHMWAALLAAVGGGISLYFGYVRHLNLMGTLSIETFNPYDPVFLFLSHAQFYALLAGAFFFADFAFHDLGGVD